MFKHSQEVREFVLNINFRGLFVISCFVSANGKEIYLQDRAIKYNDFMASMNLPQQPAANCAYY
jgi:hypothetical protein